jgi:hypothetical protein
MSHRRRLEIILGDSDLQAEMDVQVQGVKLVDHLEARFVPEVIDAREIGEEIEAELFLGKFASLYDLTERQLQSGLAAKICSLNDLKLALKLGRSFFQVHEKTSSSSFF